MPDDEYEALRVIRALHNRLSALHQWAEFTDGEPHTSYKGSELERLVEEALHLTYQGRPVSDYTRPPMRAGVEFER